MRVAFFLKKKQLDWTIDTFFDQNETEKMEKDKAFSALFFSSKLIANKRYILRLSLVSDEVLEFCLNIFFSNLSVV